MVLYGLTSYAQVRIEVVPPFIEGGGSPSWNENRNTPNSVSEDVFELKNGSTIRGNLESFSSGVYFVNIGGITKSIPENSILKINGQFLSSVRATVPDKMTAEVKVVKLDYKSINLLFDNYKGNPNRAILKNNRLTFDNDEFVGYYKINNNNDYYIRKANGVIGRNYGLISNIVAEANQEYREVISAIPLKIDSNGVYCFVAIDDGNNRYRFSKNNTDVYFYRFGAKNLEGPVAKCDNSFGGADKCEYFCIIDELGFPEIAMFTGSKRYPFYWDSVNNLTFYKSVQMNNGLFALKKRFSYTIRKNSEAKDYNGYISPNNGISCPIIGYGHFFNKNKNNWIVAYFNSRTHKVTKKKDSELYIDIFDEDVSKGVVKSLNFIIPSVDVSGYGPKFFAANCIDIDRDGITELVFPGDYHNEATKESAIIVKLK